MKDIVILGAGNFGREVAQLIKDINQERKEWNLIGFIDETPAKHGAVLNGDPVLGGLDWLKKHGAHDIWAVCAVASPGGKYDFICRASDVKLKFPNLIHPSVAMNDYVDMGIGNIICWKTFLSVNTRLGSHVAINPGCGIGHDTVICDYTTLYWDVTLSGNVLVREGCELGSKSVIIQQKTIGEWSVLGAGAIAVRDIPDYCTAVGVPAKPVKLHGRNAGIVVEA